MLQITSGKFFDPAKGAVETQSLIVLYSNLNNPIPMEMAVGRLERLQHKGPFSQYAFKYTHKLENEDGAVRPVMMSEEPIRNQLCALLSVFLKCYFSPRLELVETHCSAHERDNLVQGYLDKGRHVTMDQQAACQQFLDDVVGLSRRDYLAVVSCAMAVHDALEVVHSNTDLAYSLIVFAAECMAQRLDDYVPEWNHHPKKDKLEPILSQVEPGQANAIRAELISEANFRSMQRFIAFFERNLGDDFFIGEARNIKNPLRRSELRAALTKVYTLRSKYAHELQEIQQHLKVPQIAENEVFHWYNEPFLTCNGLLRLIRHVLQRFVIVSPKVETEQVNWRDQLPDVIKLFLSPEYYIFNEADVVANGAQKRLEGFLILLNQLWIGGDNRISDFRAVLEQLRALYPQANQENKRAIYILLDFWNFLFLRNPLSPHAITLLENNRDAVAAACTSEGLVWASVREEDIWPVDLMAETFNSYERRRVKANGASHPHAIDLLIMFNIALRFRREEREAECRDWLNRIILEAPAVETLQSAARAILDGEACPSPFNLVFPQKAQPELDFSI